MKTKQEEKKKKKNVKNVEVYSTKGRGKLE